ncbi:MAG: ATP-binding protein [Acidiferrobacterales bacterium]|nr:ATP-binding protein [Acidiferrobacterales bacterium]
MIERENHLANIKSLIRQFPVVALIGARQVGKTTLAQMLMRQWHEQSHFFDLESPLDVAQVSDPMLTLSPLRGLVVLDEIQRLPEVFPILRVLADRKDRPASFLILGSAAPSLLKQGSESLAGRLAYYELPGISMSEVNRRQFDMLWSRGGFPLSLTAATDEESFRWRIQFIRNFLERDIPQLGIGIASSTLRRFWTMVAHYHAQIWNGAELSRAFGVSHTSVRRYLDVMESTFMLRCLKPWTANIAKRQVKSPKVYFRDPGLLHTLLNLKSMEELKNHPKIGASWEGFIIDSIIQILQVGDCESYFWATNRGAEIDLLVEQGGRLRGFDVKRTSAPAITPSMRSALNDLQLSQIDVIYPGEKSFPLSEQIRAVSACRILEDL